MTKGFGGLLVLAFLLMICGSPGNSQDGGTITAGAIAPNQSPVGMPGQIIVEIQPPSPKPDSLVVTLDAANCPTTVVTGGLLLGQVPPEMATAGTHALGLMSNGKVTGSTILQIIGLPPSYGGCLDLVIQQSARLEQCALKEIARLEQVALQQIEAATTKDQLKGIFATFIEQTKSVFRTLKIALRQVLANGINCVLSIGGPEDQQKKTIAAMEKQIDTVVDKIALAREEAIAAVARAKEARIRILASPRRSLCPEPDVKIPKRFLVVQPGPPEITVQMDVIGTVGRFNSLEIKFLQEITIVNPEAREGRRGRKARFGGTISIDFQGVTIAPSTAPCVCIHAWYPTSERGAEVIHLSEKTWCIQDSIYLATTPVMLPESKENPCCTKDELTYVQFVRGSNRVFDQPPTVIDFRVDATTAFAKDYPDTAGTPQNPDVLTRTATRNAVVMFDFPSPFAVNNVVATDNKVVFTRQRNFKTWVLCKKAGAPQVFGHFTWEHEFTLSHISGSDEPACETRRDSLVWHEWPDQSDCYANVLRTFFTRSGVFNQNQFNGYVPN